MIKFIVVLGVYYGTIEIVLLSYKTCRKHDLGRMNQDRNNLDRIYVVQSGL